MIALATRVAPRCPLACIASIAIAVTVAVAGIGPRGPDSALPYFRMGALDPEWLSDRDAEHAHRVAPFALTDHRSATVTESALNGHVTIVHFFFARCGDICPTTTAHVARVLAAAGAVPELQVLSHSVTPESDSVPQLRMFAAMHGITDVRWHLLTGDTATIGRLARDSYFVRIGDGRTFNAATIAHTESVLLVDGARRLRGIYAGTLPLEMEKLLEDIATLAAEMHDARRQGKPTGAAHFAGAIR